MGSLSYSDRALDTLTLFHRKKFVVYVEGPDDILFWNAVFTTFDLKDFKLKPAGGASEIEKYIESIVDKNADVVVARDCDYTDLLGKQIKHPRILYTYGYSVENSLYCPANIATAVSIHSRSIRLIESDVRSWIKDLVEKVYELLVLDLANQIYGKGKRIMGDSCYRFLTSPSSHVIDDAKIKALVQTLKKTFSKKQIDDAANRLKKIKKNIFYVIRGHFLSGAVINFVQNKVKSISARNVRISYEHLYAILINNFLYLCKKSPDIKFFEKQVTILMKST